MSEDAEAETLDKLPLGSGGEIIEVDWDILSERDARRLRELFQTAPLASTYKA